MFQHIYSKKDRLQNFFSDTRKGFLLIGSITKRATVINLVLFILQSIFPILSLIVLKRFIDTVISSGGIDWHGSGIYLMLFGLLQLCNAAAVQL